MGSDDDILHHAIEVASTASRLAAERFAEGAAATQKEDGTEVTRADVEVEKLLGSLIRSRFPDDAIMGEEQGESEGHSGRRWVLDPINGTSLFVRRIPTFNMLLAVEDSRGCVASVVSYPVTRELYFAGRGKGSWHQIAGSKPRRIAVSDTRERRAAMVSTLNCATWSEELVLALHRELFLLPMLKGTQGVAEGMTDACVVAGHPMDYSDVAGMPLLVGEAGGRVTDLRGEDVRTGSTVLASNGHLHEALLELVRDLDIDRDERFAASELNQGRLPDTGEHR